MYFMLNYIFKCRTSGSTLRYGVVSSLALLKISYLLLYLIFKYLLREEQNALFGSLAAVLSDLSLRV